MLKPLPALLLMASLFSPFPAFAQTGGDRVTGLPLATRSPVLARNGIAATSHPLATQIALDILKQGGNAVDGAIAANAALGLMEPTGNGIGGDLFVIVWDPKTRKLYGLNASGRSPQSQSLTQLKARLNNRTEIPLFGPLPITVPGAVDGWFTLHQRFGKIPIAQILAPTIRYAKEGVPVPQVIAGAWANNTRRLEREKELLPDLTNFRKTYLPQGRPPREGELFQNPDLAQTLTTIAQGGRGAFYNGPLTDSMITYLQRMGSALTKADFAQNQSTWVTPVSTNYRGYDVYELPPNGQGIAVLQMLNILEGFDLKTMGFNSPAYLHTQVEAKKLAYADRARFYADPAFGKIPLTDLISKAYGMERRKRIQPDRIQEQTTPGDPKLQAGDTIYLTVADGSGMMVSLIQSNYLGMGSGLVADGLGFMFHDRGAQYSLTPGHANVYAPGKRPFHTIIPAFVLKDGEPWLSFGLMGGDMQPQGHVQILCNLIDFGMNVQEAGDAPRYYHTGDSEPTGTVMTQGGFLSLETAIPLGVRQGLEALGHRLRPAPGAYGGYQAILWDRVHRVYHGASEMRKDGQVAGY